MEDYDRPLTDDADRAGLVLMFAIWVLCPCVVGGLIAVGIRSLLC